MFKKFLLESIENVKESVVAPFVGQRLNSISGEEGIGFEVVFVNDKIVKVKGPKGEKTFTRAELKNKFSLGGEAANESLIKEENQYSDFASKLRDIADELDNQKWVDGLNQIADELDGVWSDGMEFEEEEEMEEPEIKESKKRDRPAKKDK